jgi:hypothetical protein
MAFAVCLMAVTVCSAGCVEMHGNAVPGDCGGNWWQCVYLPKRLIILDRCVTVRGVVVEARYVLDGDAIVYLRLDPEYAHFSNQKNYEELGKDILELEIVCRHPVFRFFVLRCWTCRSKIVVPRIGDHIEADGFYVEDTRHQHRELHPVTRVTLLRSAKVGEAPGSGGDREAFLRACAPELEGKARAEGWPGAPSSPVGPPVRRGAGQMLRILSSGESSRLP